MKIELYRMLTEIAPYTEYLKNVQSGYTFYIPTEFVINKPQVVCPTQIARVFSTNKYIYNGEHYTYEELVELTIKNTGKFDGIINRDEILLVEIWADYGSDGHREYRLRGWRFVPESFLKKDIKEWEAHPYNGDGLPDCMTYDGDELYMDRIKLQIAKISS